MIFCYLNFHFPLLLPMSQIPMILWKRGTNTVSNKHFSVSVTFPMKKSSLASAVGAIRGKRRWHPCVSVGTLPTQGRSTVLLKVAPLYPLPGTTHSSSALHISRNCAVRNMHKLTQGQEITCEQQPAQRTELSASVGQTQWCREGSIRQTRLGFWLPTFWKQHPQIPSPIVLRKLLCSSQPQVPHLWNWI